MKKLIMLCFFVLCCVCVSPQAEAQVKSFKDVSKKHGAYNEIMFLAN